MKRLNHRRLAKAGVLLAVAAVTFAPMATAVAAPASPGAPGLGDEHFPNLGNGGYDASHYDLNLRYPTTAPIQPVEGRVRMAAVAKQDLSAFNLDFAGDQVATVLVNDRPATVDWQKGAGELVITPAQTLWRNREFSVVVDFVSQPAAPEPGNPYPAGWVATPNGSFTSFQPDLAHNAIPVNDHPSDKATWTFRLDVPQGVTAVTNGVKTGKRTAGNRTLWSYAERSPLAAELMQLAVGTDLTIVERGPVCGVQYRDVIAQNRANLFEPAFAEGPTQLTWFINKIGRFPHTVYGNLGVDVRFGYALESQGLSLHSEGLFNPDFIPGRSGEEWFYSSVMVHEIAHEAFGNSVSPKKWSNDLWLNEGWATLFMKMWEQETGTIDEWGNPSIEDYMKETYSQGDIWRAQFGPVARPLSAAELFSPNAYDGGALVLFALSQQVGDDAFRRIMREWPAQNRGQSRSTDDFIAFASRTTGKDLRPFLRAWVYGDTTPPMPGHTDWVADPATETASTITATTATSSRHGWNHTNTK